MFWRNVTMVGLLEQMLAQVILELFLETTQNWRVINLKNDDATMITLSRVHLTPFCYNI